MHPNRFSSQSRGGGLRAPRLLVKVLAGLAAVVLLGALFLGIKAWFALSQSLQSLPNQNPYPIGTNDKERTNLLLVRIDQDVLNYVALVSISDKGSVKFLPLPSNLLADLAREKGSYTLASAWRLGNLDGGEGMNLLRDSLSRTLAMPIDSYLAVTPSGWEEISSIWGESPDEMMGHLISFSYWEKLIQIDLWGEHLMGELSRRELVELSLKARNSGKVSTLDLGPNLSEAMQNGDPVMVLGTADFDGRLGKEFFEDGIERAHPRVKITNSSGLSGAGAAVARYVHNLGGEVISIESGREVEASVILDHQGGNPLSSRLAPIIRASVSVDTNPGRADIEIIIGKSAQGWF